MLQSRKNRGLGSGSIDLGKMVLPPVLSAADLARLKAKTGKPHVQPAPWLKAILARITERLKAASKA
jgi:hypothetical protein